MGARNVRLLIGLLAAGLGLAAFAGGSLAAPALSASGTIAVSVFSGIGSIDTVSADGTRLRELAPGTDPYFSWSPNGERLVFSREDEAACSGCSELYVVGAGGGTERRLTIAGTNANPAWSPSGRLIAFDRCKKVGGGPCAIFTIEADGRGLHRLTPWGPGEGPPVWSGDSRRIAFSGIAEVGIYVMAADGRHLRRLRLE